MPSDQTTYRVTGMTCGGCARSMTRALEQALPTQETTVSHADDSITVRGAHDPEEVARAVAAAGFQFEGPLR